MVVPFIRRFLNHVYRWRNWDKDNSKDKFNNSPGSLCDSQLMEQRCSCSQLPFGDHKGTTLCKVIKVNSQGALYTLASGSRKVQVQGSVSFGRSCQKSFRLLVIFPQDKNREGLCLRWGALLQSSSQGTIMIKTQDLLSCRRACEGTLLISWSVYAVGKDTLAGTGCAVWALLPLEIHGDLQLCQLAAALEGWESRALRMNLELLCGTLVLKNWCVGSAATQTECSEGLCCILHL